MPLLLIPSWALAIRMETLFAYEASSERALLEALGDGAPAATVLFESSLLSGLVDGATVLGRA